MLNVAVTGNIAAGKSTVVQWFREWGAEVIDADHLVREVQRPGTAVMDALIDRFGADIVDSSGSLDREALRHRVFGDPAALAALNAIVHPAVRARWEELARDAARRQVDVLVNDIPLLFEVLDPDAFDVVVLVDADPAIRRARLVGLRGIGVDEADRLIHSQMPSHAKRTRSDLVIDNDGTLADLRVKAWNAWQTLQQRAANRAG